MQLSPGSTSVRPDSIFRLSSADGDAGFIFYTIMREMFYYIDLRQAYMLSPLNANRLSARTVLFTSLPQVYQDKAKLHRLFGPQTKSIWIANDCKEIQELVKLRDKAAMKLESSETKLIKTAIKLCGEAGKGAGRQWQSRNAVEVASSGESGSSAARWVPSGKRPTHRIGFLGLLGQKVDSIDWCRSELQRLVPAVEHLQAKYRSGEGSYVCSAFIEFHTQAEAQEAFQTLAHHQPLHMSPRFIGINPNEVIWANLSMTWHQRIVLNLVMTGSVTALIIFWAIPVAFVGILSNVSSVTQSSPGHKALLPWLGWINNLPDPILGLVQGLLPSILLALLIAALPFILRISARLAGQPSLSTVELRVQNTFFLFQVIQVFLITTVSSSATAAGKQIAENPTSVMSILSQDLPKASNFYISYFILQGLTISSGQILQIVTLILSKILGNILDTTPRKMYKRFVTLSGLGWGTEFPIYTLLLVIGMCRSARSLQSIFVVQMIQVSINH